MITARQSQALAFIRHYMADHGYAPTFEEMRTALHLASKSGIFRLIQSLQDRGYVRRLKGRTRAIELVDGDEARRRRDTCIALESAAAAIRAFPHDHLTREQAAGICLKLKDAA